MSITQSGWIDIESNIFVFKSVTVDTPSVNMIKGFISKADRRAANYY